MRDDECVRFLRWCLPRLGLRWSGYRRVRRTVCKRVGRRMRELALPDVDGYRAYLEGSRDEWARLDALCWIPLSRFYRDRETFDAIGRVVLPRLAREARRGGEPALRAWSAGCASGEEAYTLAILWRLRPPPAGGAPALRILGTDVDEGLIGRARKGCYTRGSVKEAPAEWLGKAFIRRGTEFCVRDALRADVDFRRQDLREAAPDGPFHLVLCRNLAFTYFDRELARSVLSRIGSRIVPGGVLVIGAHERLPDEQGFAPLGGNLRAYRRIEDESAGPVGAG